MLKEKMKFKTMQLPEAYLKMLDKLKIHPNEYYYQVIKRLIDAGEKTQ